MGNRVIKTMKCCLCDREVRLTNKCRKLFDKDICPECCERLVKLFAERLTVKED